MSWVNDGYEVRREAERLIGEDRVSTHDLLRLIADYGDGGLAEQARQAVEGEHSTRVRMHDAPEPEPRYAPAVDEVVLGAMQDAGLDVDAAPADVENGPSADDVELAEPFRGYDKATGAGVEPDLHTGTQTVLVQVTSDHPEIGKEISDYIESSLGDSDTLSDFVGGVRLVKNLQRFLFPAGGVYVVVRQADVGDTDTIAAFADEMTADELAEIVNKADGNDGSGMAAYTSRVEYTPLWWSTAIEAFKRVFGPVEVPDDEMEQALHERDEPSDG